MLEHIKPSDIANEVSMKRSLFGGSFLLVEGVTDCRLYGKFTDRRECELIPGHSKNNVIIASKELFRRRNDKKVVGIIDSDTDRLRERSYEKPLFMTDGRDADTMMIWSAALDNVLTEFGDPDKLDRFINKYGEIRDSLAAACYPLGLLMFISDENEYGLSFKDLDHKLFINKKDLRPDVNAMVVTVRENSPHSHVDVRTVTAKLTEELNAGYDPRDVCRGRDLIAVLAMGLRDVFGDYNCRNIRTGELSGALRLAYDRSSFMSTKLFADTSDWCASMNIRSWS